MVGSPFQHENVQDTGLFLLNKISVVQSLSNVQLFATPWNAAHHAPLSFTISRSLLRLIPSHPLLPCSPPALDLSQHQGLFQWLALHMRWPKYCSFSFSISSSNEYSGLISFRIDWFDLQGTLKSLL